MATIYKKYLDETYPLANNPEGFKIELKPHQLTSLHKAIRMEQENFLSYEINGEVLEASANIGILCDIVGYGKTITALSIVASSDINSIAVNEHSITSYCNRGVNLLTIKSRIPEYTPENSNQYMRCTLIIVPRGPVFLQWIKMIQDYTNLKVLIINDLRSIKNLLGQHKTFESFKEHIEKYNVVLIKITNLKPFYTNLNNNYGELANSWGRIMVDEAHELLNKIPSTVLRTRFYWMITGTPHLFQGSSIGLGGTVRILLRNHMIVQNKEEFVKKSFDIPPLEEINYICKMSAKLRAIRGFLPPSIVERINASDYTGAIREMGGTNASMDTMIEILTRNLKKELHNKQCERNMIQNLDLSEIEKNTRTHNMDASIKITEDKLSSLLERLSEIDNKVCAICMDLLDKPVALSCTHLFCSRCILEWIKRKMSPVCPECRYGIDVEKLINIGNDEPMAKENKNKVDIMSKENMLVKIIKDKPNGKFLVFSKIENGFATISNILKDNNITYSEIKGNTACMRNILDKFREGTFNVILLTTSYAGSGIDISFATDVIIYHKMDNDKIQAVGRAQRAGRKNKLTVHNLLYEHES